MGSALNQEDRRPGAGVVGNSGWHLVSHGLRRVELLAIVGDVDLGWVRDADRLGGLLASKGRINQNIAK